MPSYFSPPTVPGVLWKVSLRFAHCSLPYARQMSTSPFRAACLRVSDVRILDEIRLNEFQVFTAPIRKFQDVNTWFPTELQPDLRENTLKCETKSEHHEHFENGLLWSVWETASVFWSLGRTLFFLHLFVLHRRVWGIPPKGSRQLQLSMSGFPITDSYFASS